MCTQSISPVSQGVYRPVAKTPVSFGAIPHPDAGIYYPSLENAAVLGAIMSVPTIPMWLVSVKSARLMALAPTVIAAGALVGVSIAYVSNKLHDRSLEKAKHIMAADVRAYGYTHPQTLKSMTQLGSAYYFVNKKPEARQLFQAAADIGTQSLGPDHPIVNGAKFWLSLV